VLVDPGDPHVVTLESLVRPRGVLPRAVQRLTGLHESDVAHAPRIEELAKTIAAALVGRTIVAHNAEFEQHFLASWIAPELRGCRYVDTQDLLAVAHPDAPDMRLETFTRALLGGEERHRALSDALDTVRVVARAAAGARSGERRYQVARGALESYAPESPWLSVLAGDVLRARPPASAAAQRAEGERSAGPREGSEEPARQFVAIPESDETPVPFDEDAISAVLADAERGRRWFPGYRVREAQIEMARRFVRLLRDGGTLLLEGGTGVGKSLAYLAAAIPFTVERMAGGIAEPVVISTRTKLLQDQLLGKDIPAAAAMLGYPGLRALSMKGRANYVCARRVEQVLSEGREPSIFAQDRFAYAALAACARTRAWGEVGTLPAALLFRYPPLRDLLRRSVAARAELCTREQCAQERACPFGRRRAALAQAHLVVANHDLLLRWPPDYPRFTFAFVDEAHELSSVADEVFAAEVRPAEVLEKLDDLFGRPADGSDAEALLPKGRRREAARDARAWRRGVQQDFVALGRSLAERASDGADLHLPLHSDRIFPGAAALAEQAALRLVSAADAAEELLGDDGAESPRAAAVLRTSSDLRDAAAALRGAFAGGNESEVAAFEQLEAPFDRWRLAVRQVAPARLFHERFAERLEGLACVSASLFIAGDEFAALGELELLQRNGSAALRASFESPFPYAEHMRVIGLEQRDDLVEETAETLAVLARLLGGRTLGLFTSLRRMRDVAELLGEKLRGEGFDILAPRRATDDPAALVQRFSRSGGILLGARTFWQGIDIPGPALEAVVIEKLPFEVPTELRKRREARIKRAGHDAFERYTLGKMLLNLKQMSGRLIRSEDDRGIVVIVDARSDRRYFASLAQALPAGSRVTLASRGDLARVLAEVGIERAAPGDAAAGR
jgi:Rad3-related DNA helicase/DNA polymerase III epsilon subunit-like protein